MEKINPDTKSTNLTEYYINKINDILNLKKGKPLTLEEEITLKARLKQLRAKGVSNINNKNLPNEENKDQYFEAFSGRDSPRELRSDIEQSILEKARVIRDSE